jgi:hypothetical protein
MVQDFRVEQITHPFSPESIDYVRSLDEGRWVYRTPYITGEDPYHRIDEEYDEDDQIIR